MIPKFQHPSSPLILRYHPDEDYYTGPALRLPEVTVTGEAPSWFGKKGLYPTRTYSKNPYRGLGRRTQPLNFRDVSKGIMTAVEPPLWAMGQAFNGLLKAASNMAYADFGQTSPFADIDRSEVAKGQKRASEVAEEVANEKILPATMPGNYATALLSEGTLNPYVGQEVRQEDPRWGLFGLVADFAVPYGAKRGVAGARTAVENYRYPLGRPQVPEGFTTVEPKVIQAGDAVESYSPSTYNHPEEFTFTHPAEAVGSKLYVKPTTEEVIMTTKEPFAESDPTKPTSYGYNRTSVASEAQEEFSDKIRRPLIYRKANEDNTFADALDKTISGTSETHFGTGIRTLTEPGPHEVLTGTYWDLKTGQPVVRGSGLIGTEPIPVTATEGVYRSSGKFGNMSSATDSFLGGGKYGFRNWDELENYVLSLDLNEQEFNYIADLINRTKSFEDGLQLGPETTQGLIPKTLRSKAQYQQYLKDQAELSDWLMGNMKYGAKNQKIVFTAPKLPQIIVGKSENPGFATRSVNIEMPLESINGQFDYFTKGKPRQNKWRNGMLAETQLSKYNIDPQLQKEILSKNPQIMFPLHFRGVGPNPFPGMTTMQVRGIRSTFKKGGKIKVSAK